MKYSPQNYNVKIHFHLHFVTMEKNVPTKALKIMGLLLRKETQ